MTDEGRDRAIAAIWKGIERLAGAIERLSDRLVVQALDGEVPQKAETPEQPPLPGMPVEDWTQPQIEAKKPREVCNTVRVWEILFDQFGYSHTTIDDVLADRELWAKILIGTKNKVHTGSFSRILSTLDRAGAAARRPGGLFHVEKPTDELREAVEQTAKKRVAAKEVSNG